MTIEQLRRCGLSGEAVAWRVTTGRLFRIHRGVYAVGHPRLTNHGRWKAATLAVTNSALSHRSAAEPWQLLRPNGADPHITVPYPASPTPRKSIRIHRSRALRPHHLEGRHPRHDAGADPRRSRPRRHPRRAAPRHTGGRGARTSGRGRPRPSRSRSDLEDDFLALCRRHRVPRPENNVPIGRFEVDFFWRAERLIAEVDGYLYHRGRQAFREDRERDVELELMGFPVVRFDDRRIAQDPAGIAGDVLALLAKAAP